MGFTFRELVVTIAVIAFLAFGLYEIIVDPSHSVEKPNQEKCSSNQQRLAIAILTYAQDHNETLPLPSNWVAATGLTADPKVWACPSVSVKGTPAAPNYGFNGRLYDLVTKGKTISVQGVKLEEIPNPENIECTMDLKANFLAPAQNPNPSQLLENGKPVVNACDAGANICHSNGIVVSYLDGHAAYLNWSHIGKGTTTYNVPAFNSWFIDFSQLTPMVMDRKGDPTNIPAKASADIAAYMKAKIGVAGNSGQLAAGYKPKSWNIPLFAYAPGSHLHGVFNPKSKTWDIKGGTGEDLFNATSYDGQVIMIDYTCSGKTMLQVTTPGGGANMQNMCSVEADNSLCTFGATQEGIEKDFKGINTHGFSTRCDPQYLGHTNEQLASHGHEYIMTIKAGFTASVNSSTDYSSFDPDWPGAKCTNGQPLLSNTTDFSNRGTGFLLGLQMPTSEEVTVEEISPMEGKVSFSGSFLVSSYLTSTGHILIANNGTVSIKRIFFSKPELKFSFFINGRTPVQFQTVTIFSIGCIICPSI